MSFNAWNQSVLEDILLIPIRNGLSKPKAVRGSGINMVNMGELFKYARISDIEMDKVQTSTKELRDTKLRYGDLLFARQSLVLSGAGKCSIVVSTKEDTVYESHLIRVRMDENKTNPFFYFYYFKSPYGKKNIYSIVEQVAAAGIRGSDLIKLVVPFPPLREQKAIADILSCLDDKIILNNQINDNLAEMSLAIYKSWFVDFEPYQNEEFTETEHGLIPKGWRYERIGNLCDSISRKHDFCKKNLIFLNTGDIENGRFLHGEYSAVCGMPGQAKKSIHQGDILYSEIRPANKHFAFVNFDSSDYVVSTKLMVIRTGVLNSRRLYHYLTLPSVLNELQTEAESRSGTFPQIRFENIKGLEILIALDEIEKQFSEVLESIYASIDANILENRNLSELRDTLLPKLMSGEIDVSEISN